jgi:hypothetical protein
VASKISIHHKAAIIRQAHTFDSLISCCCHYLHDLLQDKTYPCIHKPEGGYDTSAWFDEKHSLGLPFPNLPYYIEGDIKISQSDTIIRHVGRSNNLLGTGSKQQAEVDMLIDFAKDMSSGMTRIVYNPKVSCTCILLKI